MTAMPVAEQTVFFTAGKTRLEGRLRRARAAPPTSAATHTKAAMATRMAMAPTSTAKSIPRP